MYPVTDIIDQEIKVDDYVVFYSNIYRVKEVGASKYESGNAMVRMKLIDPSPTTKTVRKYSKDICKLDEHAVTMWMLKKGYQ